MPLTSGRRLAERISMLIGITGAWRLPLETSYPVVDDTDPSSLADKASE
jgi:hypothetical protein